MDGVFFMERTFFENNKRVAKEILQAIGYNTDEPIHPQFMRKWEKELNPQKNILPESEKCLPSCFKIRKYEEKTT